MEFSMFVAHTFDYMLICYISLFKMAYFAYALAGRKMPYRKTLILQIPTAFIMASLIYGMVVICNAFSFPGHIAFRRLVVPVVEITLIVLFICFLFRDVDKKKRFFYASTVYPCCFMSDSIMMLLLPKAVNIAYIKDSTLLQIIYRSAVILLVTWISLATARLASKTKFWGKLQAFGEYPKLHIPMGTIYFLIYIIANAFNTGVLSLEIIAFCLNLIYLILLAVVVLLVSDLKKTESLNSAKTLLLQQQNYINKLESIQQEIRNIQHDYKNMLSGLYAEASEGNSDAVKEYIDTKLLKVDETVRENLRQMNQLSMIEIPELKGLIMTKILEAERDKVLFHMEVMFPVNKVSMTTEDLLRCVGILLDNAIEEVRAQNSAAVTLLLLQEDESLTIIVKNSVRGKPDLTRICTEGYSTKGTGRGIGLFNYQNIIRKYPNAAQETKIEGEHFVQVFVLSGRG